MSSAGRTKKRSRTDARGAGYARPSNDQIQDSKIKSLQHSVALLTKAQEPKWRDKVYGSPTGVNSMGLGQSLNDIEDWDNNTTATRSYYKEGRKIIITKLQIRGTVYMDPNSSTLLADASNRIRLLIVLFKNDSEQDIRQVLSEPGVFGTQSFYRMDGPVKYSVLYDKEFHLMPQVQASGIQNTQGHPWEAKVNISLGASAFGKTGTVVEYVDPTPNVPMKGSLMVFAISDSSVISHPYFQFNSRLRFTDA